MVTALTSRSGRRWLVPGLVIAALAVGGLFTVSSTLSNKASERVNDQRSIWDRQNQWGAGMRMIDAKPLFGFGLSRYRTDSGEYFRQSQDYPMTGHTASLVVGEPETIEPLHNLYLSYVVALGLVGALLWFGTLVWGVGGAIFATGPPELVPWKRGLLALAVFFLVVTFVNPKQPPFAAMMLWTWAGIAAGMPAAGRSAAEQFADHVRLPDPTSPRAHPDRLLGDVGDRAAGVAEDRVEADRKRRQVGQHPLLVVAHRRDPLGAEEAQVAARPLAPDRVGERLPPLPLAARS